MNKLIMFFILVLLGGCVSYSAINLVGLYGEAEPRERIIADLSSDQIDYWSEVKPVIETRCVVCHACYDAPCQLKMSSIEGIERGASKLLVYDQSRLFKARPDRLFEDAFELREWREREFHPVLNEHDQTLEANREAGLIYQMLSMKQAYEFPVNTKLGDEFEFGLNRENSCVAPNEMQAFAEKHPAWGMPYAFPALSSGENEKLTRWLDQGAQYTARPQLEQKYTDQVNHWENFLNGDSNKQRLMSRYLYEHLFLGHLYFAGLEAQGSTPRHYFQIVRSSTPPGLPINLISTRKPYDDPGVERVYYRIREVLSTIVAKTHMPYALDKNRLELWNDLFLQAEYEVPELPGYQEDISSNPFVVFNNIPVSARYKFMLDEAQYTVMGFIKGPVCRGQVALNVIRDHFWVVFVSPDEINDQLLGDFHAQNSDLLGLPEENRASARPLSSWREYSKKQDELRVKADEFLASNMGTEIPYDMNIVWDGDRKNPNAALTIMRHFDSATVEQGLLGEPPETAWLLGYTDLERIHYLLVAGYDVYGNVGHQVLARLYMDFLRMNSEAAFLLLLPEQARDIERQNWYRDARPELTAFLTSPLFESNHEPEIQYQTDDAKQELYDMISARLGPALNQSRQIYNAENNYIGKSLASINLMQGEQLQFLPEHSLLLVEDEDITYSFTLVRNNAHSNMTSMFHEQKNRIPAEDTMMILNGFVGSYPAALFKAGSDDIQNFVDLLQAVESEESFKVLVDKYGVRRTNPAFWTISDQLNSVYKNLEPVNYGVLDYNRFGNY